MIGWLLALIEGVAEAVAREDRSWWPLILEVVIGTVICVAIAFIVF